MQAVDLSLRGNPGEQQVVKAQTQMMAFQTATDYPKGYQTAESYHSQVQSANSYSIVSHSNLGKFLQSIGQDPIELADPKEGSSDTTSTDTSSRHKLFKKTRRSKRKCQGAMLSLVILFANITSASYKALTAMRSYMARYKAAALGLVETHDKLNNSWIKRHLKGTHVIGGPAEQSDLSSIGTLGDCVGSVASHIQWRPLSNSSFHQPSQAWLHPINNAYSVCCEIKVRYIGCVLLVFSTIEEESAPSYFSGFKECPRVVKSPLYY